ncbi:hypothetical protein [Geminocystis sp. GBBB08]|nr:hypothetical protein [Geminocystis sp. GBBB08]
MRVGIRYRVSGIRLNNKPAAAQVAVIGNGAMGNGQWAMVIKINNFYLK